MALIKSRGLERSGSTTMTRRWKRLLSPTLLFPLALLIGIGVWTATAQSFYFPPLTDVFAAFGREWLFDRVASDLMPSILRVVAGYFIGSTLGIVLGACLGLVDTLRDATRPLVEFVRSIPAVILIPVGMAIFGFGDSMKIAIIAVATLFPVLLNTMDGIRSVDATTLDMARAYGIPFRGRLREVILPSALPRILAGMRISLSIAIIVMVVSEMVASTNGVGYFVLQQERQFRIPEMWSGVIVLGLLGYFFNLLFVFVERRALYWYQQTSSKASK